MKLIKQITFLTTASVVATTFAFAQQTGGPDPRPEPRGMMRGQFQEERQEFKQGMQNIRQEFRDDRKEKQEYMMGSSTPGTATPTPWRNMRENMKELRDDMRGKMASLTDAQTSAIAAKLGITVESLKAKLATGTPLRQLIGNKIPREEMDKILPPPASTTASSSNPNFGIPPRERGFFNSFRSLFSGRNENRENENQAPMTGEVASNTQTLPQIEQVRSFFKRFFNF